MLNIIATTDSWGTCLYEIVQAAPDCFYPRELVCIPHVPPTGEELAEREAEELMYENMLAASAYRDEPFEPAEWELYGCYTTAEAAERIVRLHHVMNVAHSEIHAFHAPSECLDDATRGPRREIESIEDQFSTVHPSMVTRHPNPYRERGVEDRQQPAWQALGFSSLADACRADDHTVMHAMGERTAR